MSEPLAEHLSRFTPNSAGLDRDALLFAAGRASVRPQRRWMAVAGTLAASQLLTLLCLWPRTPQPLPPVAPFVASDSIAPETTPMQDPEWWTLRNRMLSMDLDQPTTLSDEPMVPSDPPLHAFGTPDPTILN